jgi:hypothetical protein
VDFCDRFDEAVAAGGPPALFTVDARGQLRLDPNRTRDAWARAEGAPAPGTCHCLFRDRPTGWVQYVLATSPDLVLEHPRADVARYPDEAAALQALAGLGGLPVYRGEWPPTALRPMP